MTAPTSMQVRVTPLPRDNFRSIVAALITALTIGGWINALGKTPLRDALAAQTRLWWIEQVVSLALAIVCIAIILRKRSFLALAFWLTVYSLVFDVVRWIFEFKEGQLRIPVLSFFTPFFCGDCGSLAKKSPLWRTLSQQKRRRRYDAGGGRKPTQWRPACPRDNYLSWATNRSAS